MVDFDAACLRIVVGLAALVLRASLEELPLPEIDRVDVSLCEDGGSAMIYAHLTNDELTGGLPLVASFDLPAKVTEAAFDGQTYAARFDEAADRIANSIADSLKTDLAGVVHVLKGKDFGR